MDTKSEFDQIVLTKTERKLLAKLKNSQAATKNNGMHALLEWRLAAPDSDGLGELNRPRYKDTCHITDRGKRYLAYQASLRADFIKGHLINFLSGFVSGVLVTVAAALITQRLL